MNSAANQINYGYIKAANHGYKIMIQKYIQYIMKGSLLFLTDTLEP